MKTIYKNIHLKILLVTIMLGASELNAQEYIELNDIVSGTSKVSATNTITLKPGFRATEGSSFRAYISTTANDGLTNPEIILVTDILVNGAPTEGENYVRSIIFPDLAANRNEQITYYDGLGRPKQSVNIKASPTGEDIIQHVYYDDFGRESRKYLPYTESGSGEFRSNALNATESYYGSEITGRDSSDNTPFSQSKFEESPLNRVVSITGIGDAWTSKPISYDYQTNSSLNSWDENGNTVNYAANTLYVNQTKDENGNISKEYKDKLGQVILKESLNGAETLKTFYIYDDFGLLRTVVPPLATGPSDIELCYFYTYDERKRMISKKLPGADIVYMVYDKRDRLVLVQDGNMRAENTGKYLFTRYDEFNRPVITGKLISEIPLSTIRNLFKDDQTYIPYEEYNDSGTYGYTSQSYPTGIVATSIDIETVTWYDSYAFKSKIGSTNYSMDYNAPAGYAPSATTSLKGLATGNMVKAFDLPESGHSLSQNEMYSVNYYDDYGNAIQSIAQNHMGGYDIISSRYQDVTQRLEETQQLHLNSAGITLLTIAEEYDYDHAGRLLETIHQVNDQSPVILNSMRYNELGELVEKYLHSKDGNSFVQKIDFKYNIRGWLTQINDPILADNDVFGMKLYYNNASAITGVTADDQFNGNIAAIQWNTIDDTLRGYGFQYDALNRLINANYGEGSTLSINQNLFSMSANYDKNGNILHLNRRFNSASTFADQLTYNYFAGTNKLQKVLDPSGDIAGIEDYVANSANDYNYDENGNMTFDAGKDANVFYNSLNLPEQVNDASNTDDKIFYHYDAAGRKLTKTKESGNSAVDNVTDYVGNIIYVNNEIAYVITSEGRMVPIKDGDDISWHYEYNIKDHLGNTRVSFGGSILAGKVDLIQQSHYYPFGLLFKEVNYQSALSDYTKNNYLYNGKELQDDQLAGRSLNWYDYGARMYDAALARFTTIDPLAENFSHQSPFVYADNNPIRFIDFMGMNAGDYYKEDGTYLGNDGIDDKKVYTAEGTKETTNKETGETTQEFTNAKKIGKVDDFLDMGGFTISSDKLKKNLVGLSIYMKDEGITKDYSKVIVASGDRTVSGNTSIGGVKGSSHLDGTAADIHVKGLSDKDAGNAAYNSGLFSGVIYYPEKSDTKYLGTHNVSTTVRHYDRTKKQVSQFTFQTPVRNTATLSPHVHVDMKNRGVSTWRGIYKGHNGKKNTYKTLNKAYE